MSGLQREFGRCGFFSFLFGLRTYQHPGIIDQAAITWLLPREARFPSMAIRVRFLVDKVALRFFFKYFDFSLPVINLTVTYTDISDL